MTHHKKETNIKYIPKNNQTSSHQNEPVQCEINPKHRKRPSRNRNRKQKLNNPEHKEETQEMKQTRDTHVSLKETRQEIADQASKLLKDSLNPYPLNIQHMVWPNITGAGCCIDKSTQTPAHLVCAFIPIVHICQSCATPFECPMLKGRKCWCGQLDRHPYIYWCSEPCQQRTKKQVQNGNWTTPPHPTPRSFNELPVKNS